LIGQLVSTLPLDEREHGQDPDESGNHRGADTDAQTPL
jgi:hypothetical protein